MRKRSTFATPGEMADLQRQDEARRELARTDGPPEPNISGGGLAAQITALANDYITVRLLDADGEMTGDAFDAAKPETLRHVLATYDWPTTWETVDSNTATVSNGSETYTWTATPIYLVGKTVLVTKVESTGVEVGGDDLKWIECGPPRTWGASV